MLIFSTKKNCPVKRSRNTHICLPKLLINHSLLPQEEKSYKGVRLATGQDIHCHRILMDSSSAVPPPFPSPDPLEITIEATHGPKVARLVCITRSSLHPDLSNILIVFPPRCKFLLFLGILFMAIMIWCGFGPSIACTLSDKIPPCSPVSCPEGIHPGSSTGERPGSLSAELVSFHKRKWDGRSTHTCFQLAQLIIRTPPLNFGW